MIPPFLFLAILIVATFALMIVQLLSNRVHRRRLIGLAREWRMHYAPDDRFNLAARVAERLPQPGAADVRIVDLIYGSEQGTRRYVFSAHYTRGVVRWKRRERCVASLAETKEIWTSLTVAPSQLSVVEQYRTLAAPDTPKQ
jgi:hypothetical protein